MFVCLMTALVQFVGRVSDLLWRPAAPLDQVLDLALRWWCEEGKNWIRLALKQMQHFDAVHASLPPAVTFRMRFFSMPSTAKTCSPAVGSSILGSGPIRSQWGSEGKRGGARRKRWNVLRSVRAAPCAPGSFPVGSKKSTSLHLFSSSLCTLLGPGNERRDIHSGAAASSSFRAVTSGREEGRLKTLQKGCVLFFFFFFHPKAGLQRSTWFEIQNLSPDLKKSAQNKNPQ